jgi:hypothetical protein
MKNLSKVILLLIIPFSFLVTNTSFAATGSWITVTVTEFIPGAWCWEGKWEPGNLKYECTVEPWFWSITAMMWEIIKYFTYIAALWAVLFIVINGILYSMSGMDAGMKDEAKKRISKPLIWLIVLLLSWVILNIIAPWVYV